MNKIITWPILSLLYKPHTYLFKLDCLHNEVNSWKNADTILIAALSNVKQMKLKLQKSHYRQQGWLFIIFFFAHIPAVFSQNEAVVYITWKNFILKQLFSIQAKCTKKLRSLKNYCNWTPQSLCKRKGYLAFRRLKTYN